MKLGMEVDLSLGHTVLHGDPAPAPPKAHSPLPQFSAHICRGQTAGWIKMPLGREAGLCPGDIVTWGHSSLPKTGAQQRPHFLAHVYCSQTARQIKVPLGMEVGLSPDHIVLDGDPARPPIFGPCLLWPNGWMDQDATWYGGSVKGREATVGQSIIRRRILSNRNPLP